MKIISVGDKYLEIDGYGGIIAYAELCNLQKIPAKAVCSAPLSASITKTVKAWPASLDELYETPSPQDTFTVIDLSDPKYLSSFVDIDRVDEIIDHHPGFEQFWLKKIGDRAQIELVGAACTLVYERWAEKGLVSKMSQTSARLLMCGILDNTLNFGASITTNRDIHAYEELKKLANLPANWPAQYFNDVEQSILTDPAGSLINDTKTLAFVTFEMPIIIGQLAVWDAKKLLDKYETLLTKTMSNMGSGWFINVICISEKKSYFVTDNIKVQEWLSKLLGVKFDGLLAAADRPWLRKEIAKKDINTGDNNENINK